MLGTYFFTVISGFCFEREEMNDLAACTTLTMSRREIAELTGKTHDNVMRDIRNMMRELDPYDTGDLLKFEEI